MKTLSFELGKIFNLQFFANRFGLKENQLSWGVVISEADGIRSHTPVILLKDEKLYINILGDCLEPLVNVGGLEQTTTTAKLTETKKNYVFKTSNVSVALQKQEVYDVYFYKVFSNELQTKAEQLNMLLA